MSVVPNLALVVRSKGGASRQTVRKVPQLRSLAWTGTQFPADVTKTVMSSLNQRPVNLQLDVAGLEGPLVQDGFPKPAAKEMKREHGAA